MKNLLLLCLLLSACTPSSHQAREGEIKQMVRAELNDPKSYESVSFLYEPFTRGDSIRVAFAEFRRQLAEGARIEIPPGLEGNKMLDENLAQQKQILAQQNRLLAISSVARQDSVGQHISHTYRAKNAFGALVLNKEEFIYYAGHGTNRLPVEY